MISGCVVPIAPHNISIREDSISAPTLKNRIRLGSVESSVSGLTPENVSEALESSLRGQGLFFDGVTPNPIDLSVNFEKSSSPTWGQNTAVTVSVEYSIKSKTNRVVQEKFDETCELYMSLGQAMSLINTATLLKDNISRGVYLEPGSEQDEKLGYPKEGSTINASDAYGRGLAARECAIRKSIIRIINEIEDKYGGT